MKHLTFQWSRFCKYARWDTTVNMPFYQKMMLLLLGSMCMPVVIVYILLPSFVGFRFSPESDATDLISIITMVVASIIPFIAMGYTFHNMLTRQGRILELTIPASTLERFVWHVLVATVGVQLVVCLCVGVADLCHMLLSAFVYRLENVYSYWWSIYGQLGVLFPYHEPGLALFALLGLFNNMAFYMLVNAWKYRYNIAYTLIYKTVLSMVAMFCLGCIVNHWMVNDVASLTHLMKTVFDNARYTLSLANLFLALLLVAQVWGAYRLYAKAQVISRRNP